MAYNEDKYMCYRDIWIDNDRENNFKNIFKLFKNSSKTRRDKPHI